MCGGRRRGVSSVSKVRVMVSMVTVRVSVSERN